MSKTKDLLISDATRRNWDKLKGSKNERLTRRANKSRSQKTITPEGYVTARSLPRFVEQLKENDYPMKDLIFSLCVAKIEQNKVCPENKNRFLEEYSDCQRIDVNIPRQILKNRQDDWIGFVYQSLTAEGQRILTGLYYTNPMIVSKMLSNLYLDHKSIFLDPCCGSGIFLMMLENAKPEQLFGFDNDPIAIMIAKANLMSKFEDSTLYPQVYLLDFLKHAQTALGNQKFDFIVTNPPWGIDRHHNNEERASTFFSHSLPLLKETGIMKFLLPTSLLKIKRHADFRQFVMENACVEDLQLFDDRFKGVFTDFVSLSVSSKAIGKQHKMECALPILTQHEKEILAKMDNFRNDDLSHSQFALGIITGNNEQKLKDKKSKGLEPIYTGKNIRKYKLLSAEKYIKFDRAGFQQCAKEEFYRAPEKLVYKFISSHLCFTYDNEQRLFLNSANILIPEVKGMSIKTVLAFLNSELFNFYYTKRYDDVKILKSNLMSLPFPKITAEQDQALSAMVDKVLAGDEQYISAIDEFIYNLYQIKL
ncbi:MAG: N-6 DNA methylase [Bacteroidales bacterium]|nr:N-6 DNA methylase [Bacteroidales bacterium]